MSKDKKINLIEVNINDPIKTAICTIAGNTLRIVDLLNEMQKNYYKVNFGIDSNGRIKVKEQKIKIKGDNFPLDYSSQIAQLTEGLDNRLNSIQKAIEKTKPKEKTISLYDIKKIVREQAIIVIEDLEKKPTAKKKKP